MKYLILILLSITLLVSCSKDDEYPFAIAWHDVIFARTNEIVPSQQIGKEIGVIERTKIPMPKKNGDSNEAIIGSKLYEIQQEDQQNKIALKVNDQYYLATKLGPLEK